MSADATFTVCPPILKPPQPCFLISLTERQQTQAYKNPVTNKQRCSASPMFINETACLDRKVALDTVQTKAAAEAQIKAEGGFLEQKTQTTTAVESSSNHIQSNNNVMFEEQLVVFI